MRWRTVAASKGSSPVFDACRIRLARTVVDGRRFQRRRASGQRVPRRPDVDRSARRAARRQDDDHHSGRRHRTERPAHGARQAQRARQGAGRQDRRDARGRAGRACGRLRARGTCRAAERSHAIRRHDLDSRRCFQGRARSKRAQPQAARLRRCRPDRRQRQLPGRIEGRGRAAEPRLGRRRRHARISSPTTTARRSRTMCTRCAPRA